MWIPKNVEELEHLVNTRAIEESASLDFKGEVPSSSKELAKDVAAMANDGGTLVFGVGEDSTGHPVLLQPFEVTGIAERISSIIHAALAEPPTVDIRTLALTQNPERGYMAVVIPASPRAPHMVIVKGDNRFYGRTAKGNVPLSEGEVARLYQRRQQWEQDREAYLERVVSEMTLAHSKSTAFLYLFARPVAPSPNRLALLGGRDAERDTIYKLIVDVTKEDVYPHAFGRDFSNGPISAIAAGWRVFMAGERVGVGAEDETILDLEVHFSGEVRLILNRLTASHHNDQLALFDRGLAQCAVRFLAFAGRLLQRLGYFGPVDIGLAATGLKGVVANSALQGHVSYLTRFDQPTFRETARVMLIELEDEPAGAARTLLSRLFHACGAVGQFDPLRNSG